MPDRTEELLTELVELTRRQLANQERALARQDEAIAFQRGAVARQRRTLMVVWLLLAMALAVALVPLVISWMRWQGGR